MSASWRIDRRTFLRGLGASVALPLLDCMTPARAFARENAPPVRMAFLYVPNGVHMPDWTPRQDGPLVDLPATLGPLAPFRQDLLVLTGLTQDKARPNGDGPGDHARSAASFLTGTQAFKTSGANIRAGVSVDQVAASRIGHLTRFPSLELGSEQGAQAGNCDSGYSCAYSSNISWRSPSSPLAKETNPRLLFERMFGGSLGKEAVEGRALRQRTRKSILDFVREDAAGLSAKLGPTDRRKMDEYLAAVREVESRLERTEKLAREAPPGVAEPAGVPREFGEHIKILLDLLVLAFRCDATRVATFMFANEGSNRSYPFIEVPEGHHDLSHHGNDKTKQEKIARINRFHIAHLAHFLEGLKGVQEGEGTLLGNSMVVYGSGLSDGNRHNHDDLPVLLLGGGGGTILPGRHIRYKRNTPLNNLFLSMLDRVDSSTDTLGDSKGRLPLLYGKERSF
jgi:uncharacterized protein DUF1552